jgi:hypothetical protein
MTTHTTGTAHEQVTTEAVPSGHGRRKRLIAALTVLAFLAIGAVAVYAISFIAGAVVLLMLSALLALIGALGTGVGLGLLHVQYAALLGVLFFFLYFVPVVGPYVIEALCILAALPQGWVVMLVVAVYMTLLQGIVLGQILSPRVFSKTVGVHPIVALFALFAGAELFGLLGGFLSVPVAGVLQQIIVALWRRWKDGHPSQFPTEASTPQQAMPLTEQPVTPIDTPTPGVKQ